MDKEETILYPTSCAMISEEEFAQMKPATTKSAMPI